jgi:hypothetical protein
MPYALCHKKIPPMAGFFFKKFKRMVPDGVLAGGEVYKRYMSHRPRRHMRHYIEFICLSNGV